jgi:hypothetical protein
MQIPGAMRTVSNTHDVRAVFVSGCGGRVLFRALSLSHLGILVELVKLGSLLKVLLGTECFVLLPEHRLRLIQRSNLL